MSRDFCKNLTPWPLDGPAPSIIRQMIDAVCVISRSCSLADVAATAIGNRISSKQAIKTGIDFGKKIVK